MGRVISGNLSGQDENAKPWRLARPRAEHFKRCTDRPGTPVLLLGRPGNWEVRQLDEREKPSFPRFYTNHANIYATPFDVVFEAGLKNAPTEETTVICHLVMSPQMAKVVAQILTESIRQWEGKHGDIRLTGQLTHGPTGSKTQPS
jgi:hypothetical protein